MTRTGLGSRSDHGLFKVEPNAPTWWSPHTGCPLQRLRLPESAVETYTAHSEENTPPPRAVQLNKVYQPQRESHACFTRRFAADKRCSLERSGSAMATRESSKDIAERDETFGQFNRLLALTRDEDDRGLVLSMAAFAEDLLGRLLCAYLREGKASADLIEGFNAPLGTFSARNKAAYAVGIVSDHQYADLELARKIRNEFAHNWEGCSFEKQNVRVWAEAMSPSRIIEREAPDPKHKFQQSMACTLVELQYLLSSLGPGKRTVQVIAAHLSTKPPA